ncbi:DUF2177 family protein [Octadecabacter ascidiaceicola]|uniref:DUF2177 domain-containing protein n=1 Tax=Octadecabacter ascidiaceicola TaxID=1655543 RepID=A0A238KJY7_9RHOB|nr:DUF2177 family protein [Octadecabacter ascidiaceicola]SMX43135.1 hypothetical protein OCA8868_02881 [Octadecabacter ascidiaceicola]
MNIVILYIATAVIFFAADAIGLRLIIKPVFDRHIAHLFADPFRVVPAAVFYLGYIAGVLWFVSIPALRNQDPASAIISGIALGLLAYGTYEFTNYATLRDWSIQQVVVDTIWGGVLTGFAAWAGVMVTRSLG